MTPARVKAVRERYRLSQTEFARVLRVADISTVRRWEKGRCPVPGPVSILIELMEAGTLPNAYFA